VIQPWWINAGVGSVDARLFVVTSAHRVYVCVGKNGRFCWWLQLFHFMFVYIRYAVIFQYVVGYNGGPKFMR
jgi:hypothetical protein